MLNRTELWITVGAILSLGLSGCAGEAKGTAGNLSAASAHPTSSATPNPTTTGKRTSGKPTAAPRPRTVAELNAALLKLADLPSGYALEPVGESGVDVAAASSKDPKCGPLVKLSNLQTAPGSLASAHVTFSAGPDGPFVDESIDALGSAEAVEALQVSLRSAVAACRQLTVTVPGQGSFTTNITKVSAPDVGEHTFATRMTAVGGPMDGLETIQVTAGVRDVVVSLTFVAPGPEDVDGGTATAVGKAELFLGAKAAT